MWGMTLNKNGETIEETESSLTECIMLVKTLCKRYGLDNGKTGHFIEMWEQEVNRRIFEMGHGTNTQHRKVTERKKYFCVFKTRYLQANDFEYPADAISAIDCKLVDSFVEKLTEKGFTIEEHLAWYFDVYLTENPAMRPATIPKSVCNYSYAAFMTANAGKIKQHKEEQKEVSDLLSWIERAKVLIRNSKTAEESEKVKEILKEFKERRIILVEFKDKLREIEKQRGA